MSLLVRRINRAKWEQIDLINDDDVSADAITNCLKTSNNTLSVWEIKNKEDIDNAILALITGEKQRKLSKLDYIIINESQLKSNELTLDITEGDTVISDLKKTHRDISNLTYNRLGKFKNIILENIRNSITETNFRTRSQLKTLIKQALSDGRLNKDDLDIEFITNEKL